MRTIAISNKRPKKHRWRDFRFKKNLPRILGVLLILAISSLVYLVSTSPSAGDLQARVVDESTKILDRNGELLYEVHGEVKRTRVSLTEISEHMRQATVAIEDKDFYKHRGVSVRGIARSIAVNILRFNKSQGGSTITQQLVKNALLDRQKTWSRKIREAMLAVQVESKFSKDEILELYLNEVPYGRNAYGTEAAAQSYFGKSANELSLAESAYLAALPQAPTFYNPFGQNRKALDARKDKVLQYMQEQELISEEQKLVAQNEAVEFLPPQSNIKAPHFVAFIQDYLASKYGEISTRTEGLQVYTTLDLKLQALAETAVKEGAEKNLARGGHNAGLVAIDPKTGQILAMVGSKDYFGGLEPENCKAGDTCKFEPHYNVALSPRQPGSSFKPYAYVTAFGKDFGYAPASLVMDVVTNFGTFNGKAYIPHNYNGREYGPISMRQALGGSLNIPAVKTLSLVGVERVTQTAREAGITTPLNDCGLSLVLGGCEVTLLDHTAGYATFANGGIYHKPTGILKIVDRDGHELESFKDHGKRVLDEQAVYLLTDILSDAESRRFIFGAGTNLIVPNRTTASKTGTTQNWRDGWLMGYTPSLSAGVWVGNNDGSFMKNSADGSVVAAPIWKAFMTEALKLYPEEPFNQPAGIQRVEVDALSGKLPGQYTQQRKTEVFASYSVPKQSDDTHLTLEIDTRTGQVADADTPTEFRQTKYYTILRSERPENSNWENAVAKWLQDNGFERPPPGYSPNPNSPPPDNGFNDGDTQTPLEITILSPEDNAVLPNGGFTVNVEAKGSGLMRLDIFLDGSTLKTITAPPFSASLLVQSSPGRHTIAVRAANSRNETREDSVEVTLTESEADVNRDLVILQPELVDAGVGEYRLQAKSSDRFGSVGFYSVIKSGNSNRTRLIALGLPANQGNGSYLYTAPWYDVEPGNYTLFVKSGNAESEQIQFQAKH